MSDKPSYLGLLNAVSNAESNAHELLECWACATPSDEVRHVLLTVSAREGEHGKTFAKRINELGYQLRPAEDPGHEKRMAMAASTTMTDLEKMEKLGFSSLDSGDKPDVFDKFFTDHTIDIRTGEMLGRYICEERDSGRLLRSCYEQLKAGAAGGVSNDRIAALEAKLDAVCASVESLAAALTPDGAANGSNGKAKGRRVAV